MCGFAGEFATGRRPDRDEGVRKLAPATVMVLEPGGRSSSETYWNPDFGRRAEYAGWEQGDWSAAVIAALRTAVARRMVSDVPVGVLLSGGLDSTLIVALLSEGGQRGLATFSVGFDAVGDRAGNEFVFSDAVAREFETEHRRIHVAEERMLPALDGAIGAMSEPMVSHDAVAFYLLAEEVSRSHKVVQSGQGADEVFAGYSWYPPLAEAGGSGADAYQAAFFDRPHAEMADTLQPRYLLDEDPSRAFLDEHFGRPGADSAVDRALRLDTEIMLVDDPVKRVDNMCPTWSSIGRRATSRCRRSRRWRERRSSSSARRSSRRSRQRGDSFAPTTCSDCSRLPTTTSRCWRAPSSGSSRCSNSG